MSFLLRLWREACQDSTEKTADWHSEIEHIQSGRRWTFGSVAALLEFLDRQTEDGEALEGPAGESGLGPVCGLR